MNKIIFHIDIDAFFARVEKNLNPLLKDKPVIIGGFTDEKGNDRGVVATCCYNARKYKIHSGMPYFEAKKLCPHLITIAPKHHLYQKISQAFFALLKKNYTHKIQILSIDECYMDCTYIAQSYKSPLDLAKAIQKFILQKLNLDISIGIAWNIYIAKLATDFRKPHGITIITSEQNAKNTFYNSSINIFQGIGRQTFKLLNKIGITKVSDFFNEENKKNICLLMGEKSFQFYNDIFKESYISELNLTPSLPKSISSSETFIAKTSNKQTLLKYLYKHIQKAASIAMYLQLDINTICVSLRDNHFKTASRSFTRKSSFSNIDQIFEAAVELLEKMYKSDQIYRLIGFAINNLNIEKSQLYQGSSNEILKILQYVNNEFDKQVLFNAKTLYLLNKN